MTRKEIARNIADETGLTQLKTRELLDRTFEAIVDALLEEGRVELRNFGIFEVKRRLPRPGRNPKTGEPVEIPGRYVVHFKPGKMMDERVQDYLPPNQREKPLDTVNLPSDAKPHS